MIEPIEGDKMCRVCLGFKPWSQFSRVAKNADGLHSYCKQCRRDAANKKTATNSRSDYRPKRKPRKPAESPTAWILPRDPRHFLQRLAAVTQHRHRNAYAVAPAQNLSWGIA